jgi:hypothetical protein
MALPELLSLALPKDSPLSLLTGPHLQRELEKLATEAKGEVQLAAQEYLARRSQHKLEVAEGEIFSAEAKGDWTLKVLASLGFKWNKITPELAKGILKAALEISN